MGHAVPAVAVSAAAPRALPRPADDVGRHAMVPGLPLEPPCLPAGFVVVLVADARQPVGGRPLVGSAASGIVTTPAGSSSAGSTSTADTYMPAASKSTLSRSRRRDAGPRPVAGPGPLRLPRPLRPPGPRALASARDARTDAAAWSAARWTCTDTSSSSTRSRICLDLVAQRRRLLELEFARRRTASPPPSARRAAPPARGSCRTAARPPPAPMYAPGASATARSRSFRSRISLHDGGRLDPPLRVIGELDARAGAPSRRSQAAWSPSRGRRT